MIINNRKKARKELKELKKYLYNIYFKNKQMLYITTLCEWSNNEDYVDIVATDAKGEKLLKYLFEIVNLKAFETFERRYNFYMTDTGFYKYYNIETASIVPFYFDRTFTLKKFTPITERDIVNCCKYFIEKVLREFWIWNIRFIHSKSKSLSEVLLEGVTEQ